MIRLFLGHAIIDPDSTQYQSANLDLIGMTNAHAIRIGIIQSSQSHVIRFLISLFPIRNVNVAF